MRTAGRAPTLDEATLERVEAVLQAACGVQLVPSVRRSLEPALWRAAVAHGTAPAQFLGALLRRDAAALETFIEHAVIGETYFLRHAEQLLAAADHVRQTRGPSRVWCAGCATGEEVYSLAGVLLAAGVGPEDFWVLGTDVSSRALARARSARYGAWSVRRTEPELERQVVEPDGEGYRVREAVRARVELRRHNLVDEPPPGGGFNVILCRNVLIYFAEPLARAVVGRLARALSPGGMLVLAPAEAPLAEGLGLQAQPQAAGVFVATTGPARPARRPTPAPLRPSPPPVAHRPLPLPAAAEPLPRAVALAAPLPAPAPAAPTPRDLLQRALEEVQAGRHAQAEALAHEAARGLVPEAYLLLAVLAEARGDLEGALGQLKRALYLEPGLALAHAHQVAVYRALGRTGDAERARRNALGALEGVDEEQVLRGIDDVTAGSLRRALEASGDAGAAAR